MNTSIAVHAQLLRCVVVISSARLKALRAERVLTQEELAHRARVGRSTVLKHEAGDVESRPSTVRRLAKALGVPVRDLVLPVAP